MYQFLVSAAHKSSGKTTISVGLCAALTRQGFTVQPFKKGPDYIDPMWLGQASGRDCFNLDPYLMTAEQIRQSFQGRAAAAAANVAIVEGNKGLYDGLALDGSNSNAGLAQMLDLPVVLVLDARGMTRGVAPLILGYQAFDRRIRIAGVILNQLGGARHESKLRAVIEHYTDVPVLGAIAHDPRLVMVERHLGLIPAPELDDAKERVRAMGELIAAQVDVNAVLRAARRVQTEPSAVAQNTQTAKNNSHKSDEEPLRIGLARDKSFGFYYPDDLEAFRRCGAEIIPFDTLQDHTLPDVDGLFIGGGFPEMFTPELQANSALRESIRKAIDAGLPVYAECGGLMYLARSIRRNGQSYAMVGALPFDVAMHDRPVGRGYVTLEATSEAPWPVCQTDGSRSLRGHEFHYSSLENLAPDTRFAFRVVRGHGATGHHDGIVFRNVLASYSHLRSDAGSNWVDGFVSFVRAHKSQVVPAPLHNGNTLKVNGKMVPTDNEGYLTNLDDWSEEFAEAQAKKENLELTESHWQVIAFLRAYFEEHRVQAQVRAMIRHFAKAWGPERGNNHYLHELFPVGGPQKQGNRLAGLLKTKGEH